MTALDRCADADCDHLRADHHDAGTGRCAYPRCDCATYTSADAVPVTDGQPALFGGDQ